MQAQHAQQAHVAPVRVPPAGGGGVLSREPSATLSPMSTADESAFAVDWLSPGATGASTAGKGDSGSGSRGGSGAGARSGGNGSSCGGRQSGVSSAEPPTAPETAPHRFSEAALRLEQELAAAMCPSSAAQTSSSSGGGSSSCRASSSGGVGPLPRSSSAGWQAAVARARSPVPPGAAPCSTPYAHGGGGASQSTLDHPEQGQHASAQKMQQ
jgi:hypothetical protein